MRVRGRDQASTRGVAGSAAAVSGGQEGSNGGLSGIIQGRRRGASLPEGGLGWPRSNNDSV